VSWTFNSIPFSWFMPTVNGLPAAPAWQRAPRMVERPLLDSGDADVARIGYEAWKISGPILVSAANRAAFAALNGSTGLLTDGTTVWSAILTLEISNLYEAAQGATGTATFTRPRAA
jgi:hypothetical protein